jgi:hypothetical protein
LLTAILLLTPVTGFTQNRIDSLIGRWHIKQYYSPLKDSLITRSDEIGCTDFLILEIGKKGKVKYIFTNQNDSILFSGKIRCHEEHSIKITNNIHEIIFLGELEKCIDAGVRMDMRAVLYRTFDFRLNQNTLSFLFDYPNEKTKIKSIDFVREGVLKN